MIDLFSLLPFIFAQPDMTGPVAVHAAYVINTVGVDAPVTTECCKECKGTGFITHGDGHKTPCPCPPDCECKRKAVPASTQKPVKQAAVICVDGKCTLTK